MTKENTGFFYHFNVKLKDTDRKKMTRENYCIPTNEVDSETKRHIKAAKKYIEENGKPSEFMLPYYYDIPNSTFADEEHYTKEYVKKHQDSCMINFDLNMEYFEKLDHSKFDKSLKKFVKKNRFKEVDDLNTVDKMSGIYILVLDDYCQAYIGMSNSIKKRIMKHWSTKKHFSRLIYGKVNNSILSIDSFGPLDTTRIFYKEIEASQNIHEKEEKYVSQFEEKYLINRSAGGLNSEEDKSLRELKLLASRKKRTFNKG